MRTRFSTALISMLFTLAFSCTPSAYPETHVFEAVEIDAALASRWGYGVASLGDGRSLVFGGTTTDDFGGEVKGDTFVVDGSVLPPLVTPLETSGGPGPRYCGCTAFDASRNQVLVVAGRDLGAGFEETWLLDLDTNTWSEYPGFSHPEVSIGCALVYSPSEDFYMLYSGGGPASLTGETWHLSGEVDNWLLIDPELNPPERFDSAMFIIEDGEAALMVGGRNPFEDESYADLWRYDLRTWRWSEVQVNGATPPGRRVPWARLTPDEKHLYMGFGSFGLERGNVLNDLWRFDFENAEWNEINVETAPAGRGFSKMIPMSAESAVGLLLTGYDGGEKREDTYVLRAPLMTE